MRSASLVFMKNSGLAGLRFELVQRALCVAVIELLGRNFNQTQTIFMPGGSRGCRRVSPVSASSSGKNAFGKMHGLPRTPLCAAPQIVSGSRSHLSATAQTEFGCSSGWSATMYKIASQSSIACVPS